MFRVITMESTGSVNTQHAADKTIAKYRQLTAATIAERCGYQFASRPDAGDSVWLMRRGTDTLTVSIVLA